MSDSAKQSRARGGVGRSAPSRAPKRGRPQRAPAGAAPATSAECDGNLEAGVAQLRAGAPPPAPHDIPWGYNETRITAMARDPGWLYVGWEVTDEALAAARQQLGKGGMAAACVLRVYDTSLRLFDGLNANSFFDVPVERSWNHHFLRVDRPRATFHVDFGLKSPEGHFAVIARSGAAEMPSDGIAGDGPREWMTVLPNQSPPRTQPYRHRYKPMPAPVPTAHATGGGGPATAPSFEIDFQHVLASLIGGRAVQGEWLEQIMGGRVVRWVSWTGTRRVTSWRMTSRAGRSESFGPVEIWFEGRRQIIGDGGALTTELGPWHVVISGRDARNERRIFDSWLIHLQWETGGAIERVSSPALYRRILGGYRRSTLLGEASELVLREEVGSSEELLGGASERAWAGASELLMAGGSELALGASELLGFGASGLAWGGASEIQWGGASGYGFGGASEQPWGGASEVLLGGASPGGAAWGSALGGASELAFAGGSELVVGVSSGQRWSGFSVEAASQGPLAGLGAPIAAAKVIPALTASALQVGEPARPAAPRAKRAKSTPKAESPRQAKSARPTESARAAKSSRPAKSARPTESSRAAKSSRATKSSRPATSSRPTKSKRR